MAQEVQIGAAGEGKVRSFWVGLGLTVITIGVYHLFWYYFVNDELKDVGIDKDDPSLAQSSPALSVVAVFPIVAYLIVPPLLSVFNYSKRIKRAQRLGGIPVARQINPTLAFLLYFPGAVLLIPIFFHFWYVTKHQNMALRAATGLPYDGESASPFPAAPTS
jgi:hypothetical protein